MARRSDTSTDLRSRNRRAGLGRVRHQGCRAVRRPPHRGWPTGMRATPSPPLGSSRRGERNRRSRGRHVQGEGGHRVPGGGRERSPLQSFVTNVIAADGTQEVAALVVSTADHESVADAARARLSSFKVPTLWLVVSDPEDVPMLATGQIDTSALQHLLRARGVRVRPAACG